MKLLLLLFLFIFINSIVSQRNISPDDCPKQQCYMGGQCLANSTATCICNGYYNDWACGTQNCQPNGVSYDPQSRVCTCKPGWENNFCGECVNDNACDVKYNSTGGYKCDKSLYDYGFGKITQCIMTDLSFENMFLGVKMQSMLYCSNFTSDQRCHLDVYTNNGSMFYPGAYRRPVFWCYYKGCEQKVIQDENGVIKIQRLCKSTHCDCTGGFPCPFPLMFILHMMKGPAKVECVNSTNACIMEQKEMPFTLRFNCSAGECIPRERIRPIDPILPIPKDYHVLYILAGSVSVTSLVFIFCIVVWFIWTKIYDYRLFASWNDIQKTESEIFYFYNLTYWTSGWKPKKIIKGLSGEFHPGNLVAIMGSSGSGKTTLMDLLSNRNKSGKKTGEIYYGEHKINNGFKRVSGYVYQDIELMSTMTVRETLWFVANLRLPAHTSHTEKKARIDEVLLDLNIAHIADSLIGGMLHRGISGGEKKRVAIAMELVIQPPILFADEPTSGLDSFNAEQVMIALKNLAKKGKTVVLSIHQPSSAIFSLFDQVMLLSGGKMAYFGVADDVVNHFASLGYRMPKQHSTPDFVIDLLETAARNTETLHDNNISEMDFIFNSFDDKYHVQTEFTKPIFGDIGVNAKDEHVLHPHIQPPLNVEFNSSFFTQFMNLSFRTFKNVIRNPLLLPGHLLLAVVVGLVIGYSYYQTALDFKGIQSRIGVIFVSTLVLALTSMSALELFIHERILYVRERASGTYGSWPFYFSKILFDVVPLRIVPPIVMGTILYWMIGLRQEAEAFIWFISIIVVFNVLCGGICFVIAAFVSHVATANFIALVFFLFSVLFGGFLVNNNSIPYLKYASIFQYAVESLMANELTGRLVWYNPGREGGIWARGEVVLESFAMSASNFPINLGVLVVSCVFSIFVAGLIIRCCSNEKR